MATYKILGTNDEVTTCECCGRTNLKKTVVLTSGDGEVRFGTECAAKAMKATAKEVQVAVKAVEAEKAAAKAKEAARAAAEEEPRWESFLSARCPGQSRFEAVRSLGGFQAARELYRSVA